MNMDTKEKRIKTRIENEEYAEAHYSGAAVNESDHNDNSKKLQDERTKVLNNNPRNNDL